MKIMPRRIVEALGVIVLVIGSYAGWQVYQGQKMDNQYADGQKLDVGSGNGSGAANSETQGSDEMSSAVSPDPTSPSGAATSQDPSAPGSQPNSSATSPSGASSSKDYKQLMSKSYQQTLQTMQAVKVNTTALKGRKISLSAYKASILQSQETFSSAEAFVKANPPTDATLNPSYQGYLAGISLARQAMGVVLNGLSSFNVSEIYTAREMGIKAQQQVTGAYAHF